MAAGSLLHAAMTIAKPGSICEKCFGFRFAFFSDPVFPAFFV